MTLLTVKSLHLFGNSYGKPSGTIKALFGQHELELVLAEEQVRDMLTTALDFAQKAQSSIAKEIAEAQPALLSPPIEGVVN